MRVTSTASRLEEVNDGRYMSRISRLAGFVTWLLDRGCTLTGSTNRKEREMDKLTDCRFSIIAIDHDQYRRHLRR